MEPRTSQLNLSHRGTRNGVALVIVLNFLVIITILVTAFLLSVNTEYSTATSAAAEASGKDLADTAVQVVIGQIRHATTMDTSVAWASQPGAIRTYGNGTSGAYTASGSPLATYKLYSSDAMTISGAFNPNNDVPPLLWNSEPALYTDLNAPVVGTSGTLYPILDPATNAATPVTGFSVNQGGSSPAAPAYSPSNTAPMPVRWLYTLRDGSIISPDPSSTGEVAKFSSPLVSSSNPIVGRIAFWTDDETSKVNINTASYGTFWDVPRVKSNYDYQTLANHQPAQHEFQRYPGHPAMTSLSTVFPTLSGSSIYNIVPRTNGGGSNEGTTVAVGALPLKYDRLYASVEEMIFSPKVSGGSRVANVGGLTKTEIEQAKFFLTAHSSAPETNLFNQPRIACWPLHKDLDDAHTTPYDKLIAYCSTIAGQPYYFQRQDSKSSTIDIGLPRNTKLYSYLQNLTSREIPGFGGTFLTKYPYDRDQILTEIFDYIRCTNLWDVSLASGTGQYTNEHFGQMRGRVVPSIKMTTLGSTMGFGRAYTLSELGIGFICNADGDIPASNVATGPGANAVLSGTALNPGEKYIQAILVPEFFSPMMGYINMYLFMNLKITGLNSLKVNNQDLGFSGLDNTTYVCLGDYMIHGRSYGGNPSWRLFGNGSLSPKGSPKRGGLPGDSPSSTDSWALYPFIGTPIKITGNPSTMTFNGGTIQVLLNEEGESPLGLTQTINIKMPSGTFPVPKLVNSGTTTGTHATTQENWWAFSGTGAISGKPGRMKYLTDDPGHTATPLSGCFFRDGFDVVRTMLPAHGDYRLVAAQANVSDAVFVQHPFYADPAHMMASNFLTPVNGVDQGYDTGGKLVSFLDYSKTDSHPDIPSNAPGDLTPTVSGDFDTPLPYIVDGAYINKPDEGDGNRAAGAVPYFDYTYVTDKNISTAEFTPNRMMPSPGMFGSLSTGVRAAIPWKTLLFRPQSNHPSYVDPSNYAASPHKPSDHLMLDLFWMPVVEPYAISSRFSTAGKVNMNYQIAPFTYIERSTGIRAVLKSEKLTAIANSSIGNYKSGTVTGPDIRLEIDVNATTAAAKKDADIETLKQFSDKFAKGEIFKSASEICDIHIVPVDESVATMSDTAAGFWHNHALTGDNLREKIYTTLYPRLTTKSNTYTVHYRVQALKKVPGTNATQWVENRDRIVSEYRGSSLVERYIDTDDPDLPDFATQTGGNATRFPNVADRFNADNYCRFRIVNTTRFLAE